ncbi:glycosyltransferase [Stieleria varia]|uniref:GDP-mannose-dependent alpha-(1-6)-phosphatidylinositol dimannoside mannosyltransferase n=1 Tax=Stieleria varia TaxID=2528005 RepID=A0A5C6B0W4_9BACT|nr:glycosyltransferase [Stieleria varia]TWU05945.1 GDP-mannose-dependent alpha-(1-6)-phosphatidylinositol dimannoside mannosyltransferase [Stieleria varia]
MKLAFVTSHPIQYQVPVFRHLSGFDDIDFQVLFAMLPDAAAQGAGFGMEFEWDVPLLDGYQHHVLENVADNPGVTHFSGCDTPGIVDQLRTRKIDAVVVNGWVVKTCVQTLRACKKLKIPCIVRGEANHLRPRPWWKKVLQRQLIRRYDAYLPIGSANRDFYASYGVRGEQMFDARYCIENDRFERAAQSMRSERGELRRQWSIPADAVCFLFCGKFEKKKHPVELVKAFGDAVRLAKERHAQHALHLLMVGDGELRAECERLVAESGLPVTFAGFLNQSEIVGSYVACDCLVLPSDHGETWGLVVNEAMACGRPAIVSDQVGCERDLIVEGETGFSFAFGDWDSLTQRMMQAASCDVDLSSMGSKAFELIRKYSPLAAAEGIRDAARYVVR